METNYFPKLLLLEALGKEKKLFSVKFREEK